ncbi:MAG: hypothetical protein Q9194_002329 [Teloschistes cf. exilis]
MRLTLLRSSRQIYVEAKEVLWTTNTFSFTDPIAFKRFMSTRSVHQKRMLRNLRLYSLVSTCYDWPLGSIFCEGLEKLSILPLQSVRIAMDSPNLYSIVGGWTAEQKKETAGRIRDLLLNPKGAEIYAEAQQAKERGPDK